MYHSGDRLRRVGAGIPDRQIEGRFPVCREHRGDAIREPLAPRRSEAYPNI